MASVKEKLSVTLDALDTLKSSISLFEEYKNKHEKDQSEKNEQLMLAIRDSMIQRFEYCTDLLWKLLKIHLEEVEKITLLSTSPRAIIRESVSMRFITEQEGNEVIEMVKRRNETSHIYHEEIAESIAQQIPQFYKLLTGIVKKVETGIGANR